MNDRVACVCLAVALTVPAPCCVRAGLFTGAAAPSPGLTILNITPSDLGGGDNDNVVGGGSLNTVLIQLAASEFGRNDLVLTRTDTAGTTEYLATTEITNNTGVGWASFELQIGLGAYDGSTDTFVPQTTDVAAMPDYDYADRDSPLSSDTFTLFEQDQYWIRFYGGPGVLPNETVSITFPVDIPDGTPIDITFRGTATAVPEPSACALAGLGFLGMGLCVWRQRRRRTA